MAFLRRRAPNPEVLSLKQRVLETELSFQNPRMQEIAVMKLEGWVNNYEKQTRGTYGGYGGSFDPIPDAVEFGGATYTPLQLLTHAAERDEVGMALIAYLVTQQNISAKQEEGTSSRDFVLNLVPDHATLDDRPKLYTSREHTLRDILQDVIDVKPDAFALSFGWESAIMSLYREPGRYPE